MAGTTRSLTDIYTRIPVGGTKTGSAQDIQDLAKSVVFRDDSNPPTVPISGVTPTADAHLATKAYVDGRTGGEEAEFGGLYWSTPAATTLAQNVWTKAAGTTTLGPTSEFTMPANNRLRHDDEDTETYQVSWSGSLTSSGNNQIVWLGISKNGTTPAQGSWRPQKLGTGSDVQALATEWYFSLAEDDYVELWVKNASGTATVTIEQGALMAHKLT